MVVLCAVPDKAQEQQVRREGHRCRLSHMSWEILRSSHVDTCHPPPQGSGMFALKARREVEAVVGSHLYLQRWVFPLEL